MKTMRENPALENKSIKYFKAKRESTENLSVRHERPYRTQIHRQNQGRNRTHIPYVLYQMKDSK